MAQGNIPGTAPIATMMGQRNGNPYAGMTDQQIYELKTVRFMQSAMESCPVKTAMSGCAGFALGGVFGLFMSSMRYDAPSSLHPTATAVGTTPLTDLPWRAQLRHGLTDMGRASFSSAKNFGMIGALFSGTECALEGLRAKNDIENGVAAGCITGGILARKAGIGAVGVGCAGFAAFSAAVEVYLRMPESDAGGRVD